MFERGKRLSCLLVGILIRTVTGTGRWDYASQISHHAETRLYILMLWMYSDFLADFARKIRTRRSFRFHPDPQIIKGLYYATVSHPQLERTDNTGATALFLRSHLSMADNLMLRRPVRFGPRPTTHHELVRTEALGTELGALFSHHNRQQSCDEWRNSAIRRVTTVTTIMMQYSQIRLKLRQVPSNSRVRSWLDQWYAMPTAAAHSFRTPSLM